MGKAVDFSEGHLTIEDLSKAFSASFSVCYRMMTADGAISQPGFAGFKARGEHLELGFIDDNGKTGIKFGEQLVTSPIAVNDGHYHHVCLVRQFTPGTPGSSELKAFVDRDVTSGLLVEHSGREEANLPTTISSLGFVQDGSVTGLISEATLDNLHIYPFALNTEAVYSDYTVNGHVMRSEPTESLELGLMFNHLLPSVIAENPPVLWMKYLPYPDYSLNDGYKFKCTCDGVPLQSEDGHLFQLNQPTPEVLRTLHCEPAAPGSLLSDNADVTEYRVAIDPNQDHLESAPAGQLMIDDANTPLGSQIMFHKGAIQEGNKPGDIQQQDTFLTSEATNLVTNFNSDEGDILDLNGHESFKGYFETHTEQDLIRLFKDPIRTDDHTQVSLSAPNNGAVTSPLMVVECLNPPSLMVHLDDHSIEITL